MVTRAKPRCHDDLPLTPAIASGGWPREPGTRDGIESEFPLVDRPEPQLQMRPIAYGLQADMPLYVTRQSDTALHFGSVWISCRFAMPAR